MTPSARQSVAEMRAERHARTFAAKEVPYDDHVHRLSLEGWNVQQIAMMTRKPVIDIRLILAGIEQAAIRAEKAVRIRRRKRA